MADRPHANRVLIDDARKDGKFFRTTWHPDERVFVMSNWEDNVCVGASRVEASDAADLIGLLANGLADAASAPAAPGPVTHTPPAWKGWIGRLKALLNRTPRRPEHPEPSRNIREISDRRSA